MLNPFFSFNTSMYKILVRALSSKPANFKINQRLLDNLSVLNVNVKLLNKSTLERLELCSGEFLTELVNNLNTFGIRDKQVPAILKSHDDWSSLTYERLKETCQIFREFSFASDVYLEMLIKNPLLLEIERKALNDRLHDLKHFFTKKDLTNVLYRSPSVITDDFDSFRYKFTYVFVLMKIEQKEMSKSCVFDRSIDYIRERHLFLERSGFYDKPNKKGTSKIENPKLTKIMDTGVKMFLKECTGGVFDEEDFATFRACLGEENFDDELLGNNIGNLLEKQIIETMRQTRYEKSLLNE